MEDNKKRKNFVRFSGLSIQMAALIGGGAWGGDALDAYMHNPKPYFTILFSLIGIGASLYFVIREAKAMSEDE